MIVSKLNDTTLAVIDEGCILESYFLRPDPSGQTFELFSRKGCADELLSRRDRIHSIAQYDSEAEARNAITALHAALIESLAKEEKPAIPVKNVIMATAMITVSTMFVGGLIIRALFGGAPHPHQMVSTPSLPPAMIQSMMADQGGDSEDNTLKAMKLLRDRLADQKATKSAAPVSGQHSAGSDIHNGYAVTPEKPIALPGSDDSAPSPSAGSETHEAQTGLSDDQVDALKQKMSILSGVDDTAPLPGSDIGNYKDMQKVLPDISASHH